MLAWGYGLVLGLAALPAVGGCRVVAGIDDRAPAHTPVDDAGTGAPTDAAADTTPDADAAVDRCGQYHYATSACEACMHEHCCDALAACQQNLGCDAHTACMLSCDGSDVACRTACSWRFRGQYALRGDVGACRARECAAACDLSCGGLEEQSTGCDACVAGRCCSQAKACNENPQCTAYSACIRGCIPGSPGCTSQCADRWKDGVAVATALAGCRTNACPDACTPGTAWGCLDDPVPAPQPRVFDPVKYTLTLVDFVSFKPWPAMTIQACDPLDLSCKTPYATGSTDDAGVAALTLPLLKSGFDGFLVLAGDSAFPGVIQISPPLVGDGTASIRWPSTDEFNLMASLLPATVDAARGHLGGNTRDCVGSYAGGVKLAVEPIDAASIQFYFVGALPNAKATATDAQTAIGGVGNVPPGVVTITYSRASDGKKIGHRTAPIRAGALTFIDLYPGP